MMKLNITHKEDGLDQIYKTGIKMVFVDDEGNSKHKPVLCKDYLSDMILWDKYKELGKPTNIKFKTDITIIYGFDFQNYESSNKLVLISDILNPFDYLNNSIEFFKKFDELFPLENKTKVYTDDDNKSIIFEFDNFYKKYIYIFSFFTLCVRLSMRYSDHNMSLDDYFINRSNIISEKDKVFKQFNDVSYLNQVLNNGNWEIIKSGVFPELTAEYYLNNIEYIGDFHNQSGIVNTNLKKYVDSKKVKKVSIREKEIN